MAVLIRGIKALHHHDVSSFHAVLHKKLMNCFHAPKYSLNMELKALFCSFKVKVCLVLLFYTAFYPAI